MSAVVVSYRLKPGVTPADFERWVREVDQPTLRGLARVKAMDTFRIERPLFGEGTENRGDGPAPSMRYVELFHIPDLAGFLAEDLPGATMQAVLAQFEGFAEAPEFLVAEKL